MAAEVNVRESEINEIHQNRQSRCTILTVTIPTVNVGSYDFGKWEKNIREPKGIPHGHGENKGTFVFDIRYCLVKLYYKVIK